MNGFKKRMMSSSVMPAALAGVALVVGAPAWAQSTAEPPAVAPSGGGASTGETPAAGADLAPGDIIVTARKRAEDILKTPVAVSALTSDDIAKRGVVSINDVVDKTPGINVTNTSSGRNDRSFQQISLRGFTPSTTTSTLTASFIDGVPVASSTALNSITDPERIEILKGPQAAYFGRNAFAGAVNVVNKLPGKEFGVAGSALIGTRDNYDVQGTLEGPIIPDLLSFRLTGRYFSKSGSYVNQANPNETLGDQSTHTGTLLIVATPFDGLTVKGFGLYSRDDDGPSAQGQLSAYELRSNNGVENYNGVGRLVLPSASNCNYTGSTGIVRPYFCGAAPKLAAGFSPAVNSVEDAILFKSLSNGNQRILSPSQGTKGYGLVREYYHLHLNIDYELGDTGLTLSSLTGYNNEAYSVLQDLDNYDSRLLANPAYITAAFPAGNPNVRNFFDFPYLVERKNYDFSQELRAAYDNDGPLTALIGASYLNTNAKSDLVNVQAEVSSGAARAVTTRSPNQKLITTGIFGSLSYHITDRLTISAEGRYQHDKIYAFTSGNPAGLTAVAGNVFGVPAGFYGPLAVIVKKNENNFLPRVIAQYDVADNAMVYASYSKGINIALGSFNTNFLNRSPTIIAAATGLNIGLVVAPERLQNYEIGFKGKFLDGHLRVALAAYYAIWSDQLNNRSTFVVDLPKPPGSGNNEIVSGLANSGKTVLKGVELDMTATPTDSLTINVGAAFNDSSIRSYSDPALTAFTGLSGTAFRGNQLPASSKYSANLGIQYGRPIEGWENGSWFVRGDASYKSKQYIDATDLAWIRSRTAADFRVGITKGPISLEGFVRNAFNNKRYVSGANNSLLTPTFAKSGTSSYLNLGLPELRTFGIKAGFKF